MRLHVLKHGSKGSQLEAVWLFIVFWMRPLTRLLFLSDFLEVIEDMQVLWIRYHVSRLSVRTNVERNRTEPGPRIHCEKDV